MKKLIIILLLFGGLCAAAIPVLTHNTLDGLQGGTTDEYYHFTSSEYTELNQWLDDVILSDGGAISGVTNTNWDAAYTHSQIAGGDSVHVSTTENTNWDTAYGWGDHALEGYLNEDGSTPLTANWPAGTYKITAGQLVGSGTTAPQIWAEYDGTKYLTFEVTSGGASVITSSGPMALLTDGSDLTVFSVIFDSVGGLTATGTIEAEHLYSTDDATIGNNLGSPVLVFDKSNAGESKLSFMRDTSEDWKLGHGTDEGFFITGLRAAEELHISTNVGRTLIGSGANATLIMDERGSGGIVFGADDGVTANLRILPDQAGVTYFQVGIDNADTDASLVFSRYATSITPLKQMTFYSLDTIFSGDLRIGDTTAPTNETLEVAGHSGIINGNEQRFYDAGNSNYVGFEAPALTANQIWVLPTADGSADEILTTNGSGTLSFARMPKAIYAELSDSGDQTFAVAGTHYSITFDTNDEISGITHSTPDSNITIVTTGVYTIFAQPQVAAAAGGAGVFHMWLQRDTGGGFADIANTNIELSLASLEEDVIPLATTFSLDSGDVIRLRASVSDTKIILDAQSPAGEPVIPSIIFTMFMMGT